MASGELVHTLEGHEDNVRCVVITHDGLTLVSGANDETLRWGRIHACTDRLLVHQLKC